MRHFSERRAHMNRKRIAKKRQRLARALEWSAVPERPWIGRGQTYLVHPSVTAACAPALREMAAALRDDTAALDEEGVRAVMDFIALGDSPFFRRDIAAARSEAERLRDLVLGVDVVAIDDRSLAIAV
jgi:hypothetical protein